MSRIFRQVFLGYFLIYLNEAKQDVTIFYLLEITGVALVLSHALNHLLSEHFRSQSSVLGCKIKIALSSLIFRKVSVCLNVLNIDNELGFRFGKFNRLLDMKYNFKLLLCNVCD